MRNFKHHSQLSLKRKAGDYLAGKNSREKFRLFGHQMSKRARFRKSRLTRNPWEKWELNLLGKIPDYEIARKTGRSQGSVWSKRHTLGIAPFRTHHTWTVKESAYVRKNGWKFSDQELARQLKMTFHMVKQKRLRMGLKKRTGSPPRKIHWRNRDLKLLGKLSDYEIARRLKVVPSTIRRKRIALKISNVRNLCRWTKAEDKLLGRWSDEEVARRLKRTTYSVWHRRLRLNIRLKQQNPFYWRPEEVAILGTMTDKQAAKVLKRSMTSVTGKRRHDKIPAFTQKYPAWTRREIALLGKFSDQQAAIRLGRTHGTVRWKRSQLGIAACYSRQVKITNL